MAALKHITFNSTIVVRWTTFMTALLALACGDGVEPSTWEVRGIVRDVAPGGRQILIEHEAIPDLMPAMTMNFDLVDPLNASQLRSGQPVEFTLEYGNFGFRILRIQTIGSAEVGGEESTFANLIEAGMPAPDFALIDQNGEAFALRAVRGKAVLLDFIFTSCPGPCPIQTATHVRLQHALDATLRERTHFVSVSLDPEHDTPDALLSYAERLGVELDGWSFVTGTAGEIASVLEAYGVGKVISEDAGIDHMLVTYLIDPSGLVVQRYIGASQGVEAMRVDIREALTSTGRENAAVDPAPETER